jgi:hypothetical protein
MRFIRTTAIGQGLCFCQICRKSRSRIEALGIKSEQADRFVNALWFNPEIEFNSSHCDRIPIKSQAWSDNWNSKGSPQGPGLRAPPNAPNSFLGDSASLNSDIDSVRGCNVTKKLVIEFSGV